MALAVAMATQAQAQAESDLAAGLRAALHAGDSAAAAALAEDAMSAAPSNDEARFALGAVRFLQAVETLGRDLYRYGLSDAGKSFEGIGLLPIVRLPVPPNPHPEAIDYDAFREVLATFAAGLARAEETLAAIGDSDVALPLAVGLVRLDIDGDGVGTEDEALWRILNRVARLDWLDEKAAGNLVIRFDASDIPWLRGYCHLLMAIAEFPLAHDWRAAFDATFHGPFPHSQLPLAAAPVAPPEPGLEFLAGAADLIAFLHLMHWPVEEPERMLAVLGHLEAVPPLSRESWRRILAETDDSKEWIPGPLQTAALPGLAVTEDQVDGWLLFLDEFEALLAGDKLLPHWRFSQGMNLRRIFTEPTAFDLVLLVQGTAALPYLEDGEITAEATWRRISALLGGDFFRIAVWFN
jgi:hypothetical protein